MNMQNLPVEVIVRIFTYYLETENQRNLVQNLGNVCEKWHAAAMDSSLWHHFDGSLSFYKLVELSAKGFLKKTESVKFSCIPSLPEVHFRHIESYMKDIFRNLPCLKTIIIANILENNDHIESSFFENLEGLCPKLCQIKFNDRSGHKPIFHKSLMNDFLKLRGTRITSIDASSVYLVGKEDIFKLIAEYCPNLEELIASGLPTTSLQWFPIKATQIGCPKLKLLRLAYPIDFVKHYDSSPGFPDLETFSYVNSRENFLNDEVLIQVLHNSPNLKELDITGCKTVSVRGVIALPFTSLENLYISKTELLECPDARKLFHRYYQCLKILDVSKTSACNINEILESISEIGNSKLKRLYLNDTKVRFCRVKLLIESCPNLIFLDLESCYKIGIELRQKYYGRKSLEGLLLQLLEIDTDCQPKPKCMLVGCQQKPPY